MADNDVLKLSSGHQEFGALLTADELAAIQAADSPSGANPFVTGIYRTIVHIANADLLTLNTDPPILVAGVAGKVPVCLCPPVFALHVGMTAFESLASVVSVDYYDAGLGSLPIWQMGVDAGTFLGGASQVWAAPFFSGSISVAAFGSDGGGPLRLFGDADLSVGDGTVDVTLVYFLADV